MTQLGLHAPKHILKMWLSCWLYSNYLDPCPQVKIWRQKSDWWTVAEWHQYFLRIIFCSFSAVQSTLLLVHYYCRFTHSPLTKYVLKIFWVPLNRDNQLNSFWTPTPIGHVCCLIWSWASRMEEKYETQLRFVFPRKNLIYEGQTVFPRKNLICEGKRPLTLPHKTLVWHTLEEEGEKNWVRSELVWFPDWHEFPWGT